MSMKSTQRPHNARFTNYRVLSSCALLAVLTLSGCATTSQRTLKPPPGAVVVAPTIDPAGNYIDQSMAPTIASIDRSLKTLVLLERGDEGPRRAGPVADTVAGAADVAPRRPLSPYSGQPDNTPPRASPDTATSVRGKLPAVAAHNTPRNAYHDPYSAPYVAHTPTVGSDLSSLIQVDWQGPVEEFLGDLAETIGYRFSVIDPVRTGAGRWIVSVVRDQATVKDVLAQVAGQVTRHAVIIVNPAAGTLRLEARSANHGR